MVHWVKFRRGGAEGFGTLDGTAIAVHAGDMFGAAHATGETLALGEVALLTPCLPGKLVALWNNSRAQAEKQGLAQPKEPLFFLKAPSSYLPHGGVIRRPAGYDGRVIYEAELGIVIGRACKEADEATAAAAIFGYTCVNDVTALAILDEDPSFPQWARAKSFDTFGAFGPAIATDIDVAGASIRALLNGRERQNYPVSDLFFQPAALVSRLSHAMTLLPGDLIACGTGPGALPMRDGATIEIVIDGIGTLANTYAE